VQWTQIPAQIAIVKHAPVHAITVIAVDIEMDDIPLTDRDTVWGRQHFDPKKGTSWHTFPDGEDTRRTMPLRAKYRHQA